MKINLPVTDIETLLPENEFIYSRTDLKGVITEANEAFCKVSAYTREEMVGKSHNIVRHPDMPPAAFEDLWRDLKAGRPWRGVVKNRRQDGGYYWVVANVAPVRENGQVIGYQSVRSRPSREEIAAASAAYARIAKGDKSIYIDHGRVVRRRPATINTLLALRSQMTIAGLAGLISATLLLCTAMGFVAPNAYYAIPAVITIIYALWFLLHYAPTIVRDLRRTDEWLERILCTGDLRLRHDMARRDLVGSIARKADKFVSSVQAVLQGMNDVAGQVERATEEVHAGITNVHHSAKIQSEASSSAAAAVEEVTVSIGGIANHAQSTRTTAEQAGIAASDGARITAAASSAIESLAGTVRIAAEQVESLSQSSQEISRITGVIREIAEQTNLLALNAAIEAARAGEQGRGFAVVADEVRNLAERTSTATQEIGSMIQNILAETHTVVTGMRKGADHVAEGVTLANEAVGALSHIDEEMTRTTQMVGDISHASSEQQQAMTHLAHNLEQIASMTEQNVAVVTQTNATVDYLGSIVDRMHKAVRQYNI